MKKTQNEVLVGTFVIFGFILLSVVVFFVSGVYLLRPGYRVNVNFNYVSILDRGAPVRMAGVRVGEVSRVTLLADKETGQTGVQIQVFIAKGVEIRENYSFNIRGTHILSEPHIEITPQPGKGPLLREGDTLRGIDPVPMEALIDRADLIAGHLEEILGRLKGALDDKETGADIRETVKNLASLTGSLNKIFEGSEKDMTESLKHLNASTQSLETLLGKIEKGEGTLGSLVSEDELYQELRDFVQEIKTHPWRLLKRDDEKKKKGVPGVPFV
ncbi:MAG: MCE family protein [Candidatus Omnitrophica bacterium]|nr:MCE family protein [Candidatus Omnitrophota bacterium]